MVDNYSEIKAAFRFNQYQEKKEKVNADSGNVPWPEFDTGKDHYWNEFGQILSPEYQSFDQLVTEIRERRGRVVALDLAGTGKVLDEIGVDKGLGVSLTVPENLSPRHTDTLAGDILKRQTWRQIRNWLKENQETGFDLVFCRPLGANFGIRSGRGGQVFASLFNRLWPQVNPGGIFLAQIGSSNLPAAGFLRKNNFDFKYLTAEESQTKDPEVLVKKPLI